jgi:transposase
MFRKTNPQLSLFDIDNMYPDILPPKDWCRIYRKQIYPLIDEDKFRDLYNEEKDKVGRPNKSVKTTISILIFMSIEKLTWREAEYQFLRRIDWLIATNTPLDKAQDALVDHTTLFKFYCRLDKDEKAKTLFQELTLKFANACGTSLKKQRTDSFFIHGWLQTLSRYGLFKETVRVFLQNLRKHKPGLCEDVVKELSRDYLANDFDLTEKYREKAQRQIKVMAKDMYLLYETFIHHNQVKHYETFKTLVTVFDQQCEIAESTDGEKVEIIIREKPKGDEIISTPHNTDARYVKKGKQKICGQKGFASESCEETNKTQFITDVEVTPSTTADVNELPNIQERLKTSDMKPGEQYVDAGFANGQTILDSQVNEILLEGPSSGRSQSFEMYNAEDRPLDVADFTVEIKENKKELTVISCPTNQVPTDQSRNPKTGNILVHFVVAVCSACRLKERCPVKIGATVATLTIDERSYVGAARHHKYMEDPGYRKKCSIRAGAEALVSELVRAHGVRKSRHRNEVRTRLQLIFSAIACNVKRYIRHGQEYGYAMATNT